MRTTIDIPDVLYRAVRSRCASEGTTIRHITVALYGDWMQRPDWQPRFDPGSIAQEAQPKRRLSCVGVAKPRRNIDGPHDMDTIRKSIAQGLKREYEGLAKRRGFV